MDNMNTQLNAACEAASIPFGEWMNDIPSDVSFDIFDSKWVPEELYELGFRAYPVNPPSLTAEENKILDEVCAILNRPDDFDQEDGFGLDRQVGGRHYQDLAIQPIEYAYANDLNPIATLILKYITTAGQRGEKVLREDIEKSLHCHEIWLEMLDKYPEV